jgi:membrane protein
MFTTWRLSGLTLTQFAKRVWSQIKEDDVFGRAAQLSYYFLLALFPLLLFLMTLLGYFAGASTKLRDNLLSYLGTVMPYSAVQLVHATLDEVTARKGGGKLSFGLLFALWAASNGMSAISETLNIAYEVEEKRPWWKVRLIAIGLTLLLAVLIISALVIVLYGERLAELVVGAAGLSSAVGIAWKFAQWPIVLLFLLIGFGSIYYFAPDLRKPEKRWEWLTPGAVVAIVLWLLISLAFRLYLHFFNSYSATYGSLGALIILMLWFYLTGIAILVGGEINSELELAAVERKRRLQEI